MPLPSPPGSNPSPRLLLFPVITALRLVLRGLLLTPRLLILRSRFLGCRTRLQRLMERSQRLLVGKITLKQAV